MRGKLIASAFHPWKFSSDSAGRTCPSHVRWFFGFLPTIGKNRERSCVPLPAVPHRSVVSQFPVPAPTASAIIREAGDPRDRETERREPSRSRDTSPRMGLLPPPRDSNSPRPPAFVSFEPPSRSVRALSNNSASASSASTTVGHRLPSPPVSPLSRPAILSRRTPQQQQPPCRWPPRQ